MRWARWTRQAGQTRKKYKAIGQVPLVARASRDARESGKKRNKKKYYIHTRQLCNLVQLFLTTILLLYLAHLKRRVMYIPIVFLPSSSSSSLQDYLISFESCCLAKSSGSFISFPCRYKSQSRTANGSDPFKREREKKKRTK